MHKSASVAMYDLESEWPAHNQGKTLGWKAREKTQYKNIQLATYLYNMNSTEIISKSNKIHACCK